MRSSASDIWSDDSYPMICPRCGTENRTQARFCDGCGYSLIRLDVADEQSATTIDLDDDQQTQRLDVPNDPTRPLLESDTRYIGEETELYPPIFPEQTQTDTAFLSPSATQELPRIGEMADTQSKSYSAREGTGGKKLFMPHGSVLRHRKLVIILAICAVILAGLGIAAATYSLEIWGGKQIPDVVGLKAQDATDRLEQAGFSVSQVLVKSDDVEGIVLGTHPETGIRAEAGSEVVIDVSCARVIPEVVGKTLDEAMALLQAEGFENVEVAEEKSNDAAGTVLAVSPEVGVRSKAQATITLTASVPFTVPAVAGLSLEEAQSALEAEGYMAKTAFVYTEDAPEGSVLGTDPGEGTELASGSEVTINVAKSRASEVIQWARSWFEGSSQYTIDGISYELKSISDISYIGNDQCSFQVVMQPFETHSWFGSVPETRYGNEQTIKGEMSFSADGKLASVNPNLKRA